MAGREQGADPGSARAADWVAAVEAGFVSTLQLLSTEEVAAGLARFRERYPDPDQIVRYDVNLQRMYAIRRSLA